MTRARWLALVIWGAAAAASAAPTPAQALTTALAGPTVPFDGHQKTTVWLDGGAVSSDVAVWGDGRGHTRHEYRGGAAKGVVMLQRGASAWQRQGSGPWIRLPSGTNPDRAREAQRIVRNYRVTAGPPARLLGRQVIPLRVDQRRPYTPSRRIWVEAGTGLILRDDLFAPDGRIRSSSRFTDVRTGPQPAALFAPPSSSVEPDAFGPTSFRPCASRSEAVRLSGRPGPAPRWVPPGFTVEMYGAMKTRHGTFMPAVRYSDGLAAFTIFRRGPGAGLGPGAGRQGGGQGFGRQGQGRGWRGGRGAGQGSAQGAGGPASDRQRAVVIVSGPSNYLIIGDIAEAELRKVGASLT